MYAADPRLSEAHKIEMMKKAALIAQITQGGGPTPVANMVAQQAPAAPPASFPALQEVTPAAPAVAPGVDLTRPGQMQPGQTLVPQQGLVVDQPGTGAAPQVYDQNAIMAGQPISAAPVPIKGKQDFLQLPGHNASMSLGGMEPAGGQSLETRAPVTPEEVAQRKSAWAQLFENIQSNPAMLLALTRVGADLMQPLPMWQTPAGHVGRAVSSGLDYLQAYEGTKLQREKLGADIAATRAGTAQTQAVTETERQKPDLITAQTTKIYQDMDNDLRQLGIAEGNLQVVKDRLAVDKELTSAQIAKTLADAVETRETMGAKKAQLEAYAKWLNRRYSGPGAGGKGGGGATWQKVQEMAQHYIDELGMTEEEAWRRALALGGEGAAGGKAYMADEGARLRLESLYLDWQEQDPQDLKDRGNPKTFKEYVKSRNGDFDDDEEKAVKSRAYHYADKYEKSQRGKAAGEGQPPGSAQSRDGQPGASAPAKKASGQPLPMKDGKPDLTGLKKGERYMFMDGRRSGKWNGSGWEDVK